MNVNVCPFPGLLAGRIRRERIHARRLIPRTWRIPSFGQAKPGARLTIGVDALAKHIEKLVSGSR